MTKIIIKTWENELARNTGECNSFAAETNSFIEAIETAKNLFNRQDFAAVEVEHENKIFHISTDCTIGEIINL